MTYRTSLPLHETEDDKPKNKGKVKRAEKATKRAEEAYSAAKSRYQKKPSTRRGEKIGSKYEKAQAKHIKELRIKRENK